MEKKLSIISHKKAKSLVEKTAAMIFRGCAIISVLAVVTITGYMIISGTPAIFKEGITGILFSTTWAPTAAHPQYGIAYVILTSIVGVFLAICIGVPIGLFTAINLAEIAPARLRKILKSAIELLAGIPSVVYGFFGMVVLVPAFRNIFGNGNCVFTASILLGIMILPTIIGVSESAIRAVPDSYYEGSLGLGASHERSVFFAVLPAAKSGILAGIVLGIGRAIGETMAVVMVAGNQAIIPDGMFSGVRTLTSNIVLEMGYATDLHREALIATAVVLFVFILMINLCFAVLKSKEER